MVQPTRTIRLSSGLQCHADGSQEIPHPLAAVVDFHRWEISPGRDKPWRLPSPHELIGMELARMAIITSHGPTNPDPNKWWDHVVNERMRIDSNLGVVELESEYLATNNAGAIMTCTDAYDPEGGGYVPGIKCGDPHPVRAGLRASAVDWVANMDDVIRVHVKWVGECPIVTPSHGEPWAGGDWRPPPPADGSPSVVEPSICDRCDRGFEPGTLHYAGRYSCELVCPSCLASERAWWPGARRIAAGIGGLIAWGAWWWLIASYM